MLSIEYLDRQTRQDKVDERIVDEAASIVSETQRTGQRLGKEILHELANLFADFAIHYQPKPTEVRDPETGAVRIVLHGGDEQKFRQYGELAMQAAKDVAVYQSPRLSAVVLGGPVETHFVVTGGLPADQDGSLIDAKPNGTVELDAWPGLGARPAEGTDHPADVPPPSVSGIGDEGQAQGASDPKTSGETRSACLETERRTGAPDQQDRGI